MTAPLRLAFIGGGLHSAVGGVHYAAARLDNRFEIEAGCFSASADENRATAAAYSVADDRRYDDWRTLLDSERGRVDAVVVLTPTPMHLENVAAALRAGYRVICEKALAERAEDAAALSQLVAETDGFLAVTFNYSGYPMVRELSARIAAGDFGRILQIHAEMPQEGYRRLNPDGAPARPQAWRLSTDAPMLHLDLATHLHHLIVYLLGAGPTEVVADAADSGVFPGVVDDVAALCRFADGTRGRLWFSKAALGRRNGLSLQIYGETLAAEWTQIEPETLRLSHPDGRVEILDRGGPVVVADAARYQRFKAGHPAGFIEAFANLYSDIADSLSGDARGADALGRHVFGADHAADGLRFIAALERSRRENAWVAVETAPASNPS